MLSAISRAYLLAFVVKYTVETVSLDKFFDDNSWDLLRGNEHYVEFWRTEDGLIHRERDPAIIVRHNVTHEVVGQEWRVQGLTHRDGDQPARITELWHVGTEFKLEWYQEGLLHREHGPAELFVTSLTQPSINISEEWRKAGKLHRVGGPASIHMWPRNGGVIDYEAWYIDGKLDNPNGPALIERDEKTGVVIREEWRRQNREYRDAGPTTIIRASTGEIVDQWRAEEADDPLPGPQGPQPA